MVKWWPGGECRKSHQFMLRSRTRSWNDECICDADVVFRKLKSEVLNDSGLYLSWLISGVMNTLNNIASSSSSLSSLLSMIAASASSLLCRIALIHAQWCLGGPSTRKFPGTNTISILRFRLKTCIYFFVYNFFTLINQTIAVTICKSISGVLNWDTTIIFLITHRISSREIVSFRFLFDAQHDLDDENVEEKIENHDDGEKDDNNERLGGDVDVNHVTEH